MPELKKTRVVNVRDYPFSDDWPQSYIYVGRQMPSRFKGHPLGNPFKLSHKATQAEREACLEKYRAWLEDLPERDALLKELADQVRETGLPLGCWCAPATCHAGVLAELVDRRLAVTS